MSKEKALEQWLKDTSIEDQLEQMGRSRSYRIPKIMITTTPNGIKENPCLLLFKNEKLGREFDKKHI